MNARAELPNTPVDTRTQEAYIGTSVPRAEIGRAHV